MTLPIKLERPVVFFDLETTGLDYKYDRIIELGAVKLLPDGSREVLTRRFNPGMRIPAEVTALTGISNNDVAGCGSFLEAAREIDDFFRGCDLGGYNVIRFDAKVITEEFKRAGLDFQLEQRAMIDSQVIYHQKERRDLAAALKFYCEKDLESAHSAQADIEATVEIWLAQLERYPDLPRDVPGLHSFCKLDRDRFVDSEGKFFWRDGEAVFNFGKHKSKSLRAVAETDPNYFSWMISPERHFAQDVIDICYNAMNGQFPKKAG